MPDQRSDEAQAGRPSDGRDDMDTNSPLPPSKVMDLLLDAVCLVDARGVFAFISAAGERIFGYRPEEMIGRPVLDFVHPDDRARTLQAIGEIVDGQLQPHFENRYVRKDGKIVHIMWSARWSERDQMRVAVARDITERKRADSMQAALYAVSEAAHAAEDLVALFGRIHQIIGDLLPAVNFFVALVDAGEDALTFPYCADEFGQAPAPQKLDSAAMSAEVIRTGQVLLLAPQANPDLTGQVWPDVSRNALHWLGVPLSAKENVIGALVVQSYDNEARYTQKDIELLQFVANQVAPVIERKQMELWLQHIARHDPLTDLPNRELFHDRLQTALRLSERNPSPLSLLYLDLDRFKQVNDTLGHSIGDLLLQEVARRLRHCVRESDTVGRIGGDEFMVLLNGIDSTRCALAVAEKIRAALDRPFELAGQQVHVSPSIGVVFYPEHGRDYTQLIRYADEAMYDAKKKGGNRVQLTARPPR
jgi:diguanylate cyclase (GGDEF)-like protein/PAS domain S-box-containing protein